MAQVMTLGRIPLAGAYRPPPGRILSGSQVRGLGGLNGVDFCDEDWQAGIRVAGQVVQAGLQIAQIMEGGGAAGSGAVTATNSDLTRASGVVDVTVETYNRICAAIRAAQADSSSPAGLEALAVLEMLDAEAGPPAALQMMPKIQQRDPQTGALVVVPLGTRLAPIVVPRHLQTPTPQPGGGGPLLSSDRSDTPQPSTTPTWVYAAAGLAAVGLLVVAMR